MVSIPETSKTVPALRVNLASITNTLP